MTMYTHYPFANVIWIIICTACTHPLLLIETLLYMYISSKIKLFLLSTYLSCWILLFTHKYWQSAMHDITWVYVYVWCGHSLWMTLSRYERWLHIFSTDYVNYIPIHHYSTSIAQALEYTPYILVGHTEPSIILQFTPLSWRTGYTLDERRLSHWQSVPRPCRRKDSSLVTTATSLNLLHNLFHAGIGGCLVSQTMWD